MGKLFDLLLKRETDRPTPPKAPKLATNRPFKAGDRTLDKKDIITTSPIGDWDDSSLEQELNWVRADVKRGRLDDARARATSVRKQMDKWATGREPHPDPYSRKRK